MGGCGSKDAGPDDLGEASMYSREDLDLEEGTMWTKPLQRMQTLSSKLIAGVMETKAKPTTTSQKRGNRASAVVQKPKDKVWHGNIDEVVLRIEKQAHASSTACLTEKTLLHASEMFAGDWLDTLRAIGSVVHM